jgi:L-asparagine transporter-like permease
MEMQKQVNKKGQLGLDTARNVMLALLIIGVIAFAIIIMFVSLKDTNVSTTSGSSTVVNETGGFLNASGYTVDEALNFDDFSMTVIQVRNGTNGSALASSAFTSTNAGVLFNATSDVYPTIQVDYSFTYNQFSPLSRNITSGTADFFSNTGTWFSLLAIVVIILIIAIVIFAVNRFGGGSVSGDRDSRL